jgi:transcriptional regulator with XRE-family HTH domain
VSPKEPETLVRIGANIRRARQKAGLSQAALAEASGLSAVAISLIEAGKKDLRVSTLVMIARALKVEPERLFKRANRKR